MNKRHDKTGSKNLGKVNIYSPGGLLLGKIGEGEIFGERGPSLDESRSVTAEAATNCILLR